MTVTVKQKLFINLLLLLLGVGIIAAGGIISILKIDGKMKYLINESSPVQIKMIQLRRIFQQASANFTLISEAPSVEELERIRRETGRNLEEMETIHKELSNLGFSSSQDDADKIRKTYHQLSQMAEQRLQSLVKISESNISQKNSIAMVDEKLHHLALAMEEIDKESFSTIEASKVTNTSVNNTIKKLLKVKEKLWEIQSILSLASTIENKYKLTPLKDRMKAATDTISSIDVDKDSLSENIQSFSREFMGKFSGEGGFISVKADSLSNKEASNIKSKLEEQRKELEKLIDEISIKLSEEIDPLELIIPQENQKMDLAIKTSALVRSIVQAATVLENSARALEAQSKQMMMAHDEKELSETMGGIETKFNEIGQHIEVIRAGLASLKRDAELSMLEELSGMFSQMKSSLFGERGVSSMVKNNLFILSKSSEIFETAKAVITQKTQDSGLKVAEAEKGQSNAVTEVQSVIRWSVRTMLVVGIVTIILGVVIGMWIYRSISRPIVLLEHTMSMVSTEGDVSARIPIKRRDEIGKISETFNGLMEKFQQIIAEVKHSTYQLVSASSQLSSVTSKMQESAASQEDQATQVSAATSEMNATASDVAANVSHVSEFTTNATTQAKHGGEVINKTLQNTLEVAQMMEGATKIIKSLEANGREIGQIVNVINEIADQTNLLALNAAIEAARAGDQGRGFAVVADEVRKLAEKTTQSTKQISQMIDKIQDDTSRAVESIQSCYKMVNDGVSHSEEAKKMLEKIVLNMNEITTMVHQIATAAEEQSSVTDNIAENILKISTIAKENSERALDTTSSSSGLSELAEKLNTLVGQFKSDNGTK